MVIRPPEGIMDSGGGGEDGGGGCWMRWGVGEGVGTTAL